MRLIIADSNDLTRAGLRSILSVNDDIEIVGEAKSSLELFEMLHSFDTDVILIDYTSNGFVIDDLSRIKNDYASSFILAITPEQSAQVLVDALKQGVTSYVKKNCSISEITDAVKETAKGTKFFCGQIVETIQQANLNIEDIDYDAFSCDAVLISKREQEIIVLISEGMTNVQIAEKLFLSNHTVNSHRKNIMAKLGVKNTAGIVMYAVKSNLVSPNKFLFTASN
ncbi:MAG TPA: response regulator transcription factor [Crocinitomicaceae bacterium]|nr:response regulator transcription factor [Crocinitomicaceae bacterium]